MAETWKYYSLLKRAFFRTLPHNTEDAGTVWSPDLLGFRCQGRKYVWLLVLSSHFPSGWEWDTGEDEQPFPKDICQGHWNRCVTWCQRHQNSCATGCHLPKWPGKLPVYIGTCAHTLIYFRDHMKNVRFTFHRHLLGDGIEFVSKCTILRCAFAWHRAKLSVQQWLTLKLQEEERRSDSPLCQRIWMWFHAI